MRSFSVLTSLLVCLLVVGSQVGLSHQTESQEQSKEVTSEVQHTSKVEDDNVIDKNKGLEEGTVDGDQSVEEEDAGQGNEAGPEVEGNNASAENDVIPGKVDAEFDKKVEYARRALLAEAAEENLLSHEERFVRGAKVGLFREDNEHIASYQETKDAYDVALKWVENYIELLGWQIILAKEYIRLDPTTNNWEDLRRLQNELLEEKARKERIVAVGSVLKFTGPHCETVFDEIAELRLQHKNLEEWFKVAEEMQGKYCKQIANSETKTEADAVRQVEEVEAVEEAEGAEEVEKEEKLEDVEKVEDVKEVEKQQRDEMSLQMEESVMVENNKQEIEAGPPEVVEAEKNDKVAAKDDETKMNEVIKRMGEAAKIEATTVAAETKTGMKNRLEKSNKQKGGLSRFLCCLHPKTSD